MIKYLLHPPSHLANGNDESVKGKNTSYSLAYLIPLTIYLATAEGKRRR